MNPHTRYTSTAGRHPARDTDRQCTLAQTSAARTYAHRIHAGHGAQSRGLQTEGTPVAKPSLRAYLDDYAAGRIGREEMLATVAAWELEEREWDLAHTMPDHQDNTAEVISGAVLNDRITEDDYREIWRRRGQII
ncbi:hypothetical protein [Streptomyces griseocarneus]|uniref:hypothetical protein n=1 Tax=Streptomyces griseocarneus TaxID=51201 RepID=UPI00167C9B67|nr:hypothetical protein [Streptomyces griseocarneus]MBZ6475889.1 hypothetical protein [Streptomyces griseocarneus]GHG50196.1 hypothetical protein GCM10018779_10080 [Streptomyces griseocarneus]